MSDLTPMMQQYSEMKKKYKDAILFFRLGDFYEMFGDDAKIASGILQITLTARSAGEGRQIKMPMCGVPFHAANSYIIKLINNGFKVAICEQVEDPKLAKGIVRREIIKIITPGTVLDEAGLDKKTNNYLLSLYIEKNEAAIAFVDISTGEFYVEDISFNGDFDKIIDEIEKIQPAEIMIPESFNDNKDYRKNIIERLKIGEHQFFINLYSDWNYQLDMAQAKLIEHFEVLNLESFGIERKNNIICSAGALMNYLYETQKTVLFHINKISFYNSNDILSIDAVSLRNLEIVESNLKGARYSTLYDVLDYTETSMGGRELKKWVKFPLTNLNLIRERQDIIQFFLDFSDIRENIKDLIKEISDIERIAGKLGSQSVNARELIALKNSINSIKKLNEYIKSSGAAVLKEKFNFINPNVENIYNIIDMSIAEDPPLTIKEGQIIKAEYNEEIKKLKEINENGKTWIASLQERERKKTKISSLKVGYTSIFGYYIEISKANLQSVPQDYIRKQTLVNGERFITPELKEYESMILGAQEKIKDMEYKVFCELRDKISKYIADIQELSKKIALIDCLQSLSTAALKNNYEKPDVNLSDGLFMEDGRHPVVEMNLGYNEFISNNINMDNKENLIMIITGPNMAGKSTYMRQVALIVIMAQIGSFIPAKNAKIGIIDKIFTRVGAADYLARGQSTFMVEMIETANILNNATPKSLILLDEVGRGTSTFDGISIAWAITEYIHNKIKAKTLFATHYYELTELSDTLKGIKNYNIQVKEWGDKIIFLRKIISGSTDKSYGIHVAKLAGLPGYVIDKANKILKNLENANYTKDGKSKIADSEKDDRQQDLFDFSVNSQIISELENIDLDSMSPIDVIIKLRDMKDRLK